MYKDGKQRYKTSLSHSYFWPPNNYGIEKMAREKMMSAKLFLNLYKRNAVVLPNGAVATPPYISPLNTNITMSCHHTVAALLVSNVTLEYNNSQMVVSGLPLLKLTQHGHQIIYLTELLYVSLFGWRLISLLQLP